jgi:radical SAM superfamily enzyme YgiQ (UPF0313 family)
LEAYTRDLNYDCIIKEFSINDRLEKVVEEIMSERPDIAAFSCYVWNIEYIKQLVALIKLIDSSVKILYGGPEVSYNSENFMKSFMGEYLIEGEGEDAYRELIGCLINNTCTWGSGTYD